VSVFGVDYAWGRPGAAALKAARIDGHPIEFACRYLSHDTTGKNLTAAEANILSRAGIWIVVVWESTAGRALAGHAAGAADARAALSQAQACGMPPGRPIYFAVDFDATEAQQAAIHAYLDGAASVLGRDRVGLYGGYYVIKRAFDAEKIAWGWQTYAWSGGHWDGRAQLQQYSNDRRINGVGLDYDRATKIDYGQWRVGVTPTLEEDDMDPSTSVKVGETYDKDFGKDSYPASFVWIGAFAEAKRAKAAALAGNAAIAELTKTVAQLAANTDDVDVDALVARIEAAIENVVIHLDVPDAPAEPPAGA
jgi:Rv2525c-like, glycoside hydrolase-like domain